MDSINKSILHIIRKCVDHQKLHSPVMALINSKCHLSRRMNTSVVAEEVKECLQPKSLKVLWQDERLLIFLLERNENIKPFSVSACHFFRLRRAAILQVVM